MVFTITVQGVDVSSFIFRVINFDYKSNWPGFFSLLYLWPFFQKKTIKFWNSFQHKKNLFFTNKGVFSDSDWMKNALSCNTEKMIWETQKSYQNYCFIRDWKNLVHECRIHVKLHICIYMYIYLHINLFFVDIHIYTVRFLKLNFALQNTSKVYILKLQRQYF